MNEPSASSDCHLVRGGMRLVFLDIDGVLLPYNNDDHGRACKELLWATNGCPGFDPTCIAELNLICGTGRASIVVSSTWRRHIPEIEVMREMLREQGVNAPVVGMTPFATDDWPRSERGDEITAFMATFDVEAFVIIDDADMGFTGLRRHWVQTNGHTGITRRDTVKALEILVDCKKLIEFIECDECGGPMRPDQFNVLHKCHSCGYVLASG